MASEAETLIIRVKLLGQKETAAGAASIRAEIRAVALESKAADASLGKAAFHAGLLGAGWHQLRRAAHGVGLAVAGAGVAAVVSGVHFEQEMAKVASVVDLTGGQYQKMSQMALTESTKTRFSAIQAADAMYLLGRAGFKANEIMTALPGTLALAHASAIDLTSAAQIQGEALRGFNLEADQAGRVADVLARATKGGAVSMADLQYTIKYVGAASFSTGQKMEDMIALVEALGRHGIRGTQAGTSLRSMLTRLVDPVKKTKDGLAMMNMQAKDLYGPNGLLPLPDILDKMRIKLKALDPVSANQAVHQVFGQWAFSGAQAVLLTDAKRIRDFRNQLLNAKGTANEMAEVLNNTVQMQLLRFWHTLQSIGIGIYMAFRMPIKDALKDINEWLSRIVRMMPYLQFYLEKGDWHGFTKELDRIVGAGGRLDEVIWRLVDGAKVFWTFVSTVIFPVAKQWAMIIGVGLYGAFVLIVGIMRLMNHHTSIARFLIGFLILAYLHWKVYTLIVVGVQKALLFWEALQLMRLRVLKVATLAYTGVIRAMTFAMALARVAAMNLAIAMVANPVVIIIIAIILLVALLVLLYIKWGRFHKAVDSFANFLWRHWEILAFVPIFGQAIYLIGMVVKHWRSLVGFFRHPIAGAEHVWDWLKDGFISVLNWIITQFNRLNFTFNVPQIDLGPFGSVGGGSYNIGVGHYGLIETSAQRAEMNAAAKAANFFPPKVLDTKGPMSPDPSKNPYINPTVDVYLDGKKIASSVAKHNSDTKARGHGARKGG